MHLSLTLIFLKVADFNPLYMRLAGNANVCKCTCYVSISNRATVCGVCGVHWCMMDSNRLKINAKKTQIIWPGTKQQLDKLSVTELSLLCATVTFSSMVHDLGFLLDSQLTMKDHVSALCQSCFWQLRQLQLMRLSSVVWHWHMPSPAAVLTTATACCMLSAMACWEAPSVNNKVCCTGAHPLYGALS